MESLQHKYISFSIKEGILYGLYKDDLKITLQVAKEVLNQRVDFCVGQSYPVLEIFKGNVSMERDAREYLGTVEASRGITKIALLTDSMFAKVTCNWYLSFSPPSVPAKLFEGFEEAICWLKEY